MAYSFQLDSSQKFNRDSEVFSVTKNNAHIFDLVVGYLKEADKYYICTKAYSHKPELSSEFNIACEETFQFIKDFLDIKDFISLIIQDGACDIQSMTLDNLLIYINNDFLDDILPLEDLETATIFDDVVLLWLEQKEYLELTALDSVDDRGEIYYEELMNEVTIPEYYSSYIEAPSAYYLSLNKEKVFEKISKLKED